MMSGTASESKNAAIASINNTIMTLKRGRAWASFGSRSSGVICC